MSETTIVTTENSEPEATSTLEAETLVQATEARVEAEHAQEQAQAAEATAETAVAIAAAAASAASEAQASAAAQGPPLSADDVRGIVADALAAQRASEETAEPQAQAVTEEPNTTAEPGEEPKPSKKLNKHVRRLFLGLPAD